MATLSHDTVAGRHLQEHTHDNVFITWAMGGELLCDDLLFGEREKGTLMTMARARAGQKGVNHRQTWLRTVLLVYF
jgi:hypothetical protein